MKGIKEKDNVTLRRDMKLKNGQHINSTPWRGSFVQNRQQVQVLAVCLKTPVMQDFEGNGVGGLLCVKYLLPNVGVKCQATDLICSICVNKCCDAGISVHPRKCQGIILLASTDQGQFYD